MQGLIQQFNRGQQAAFTTIYDRHWPAIYYFVRKFVPDTAQAEDITAETFIKLWQRKENFSSEQSIVSFLHTTARNASIDRLRAEKRDIRNRDELIHLLQQDAYTDQQNEVNAELLRLVQQEIEKLPKKIRRVFTLAYVEGKSNEEIADQLGIHNQSVRNHKARALKLLKLGISGKHLLLILVAFAHKRI